MSILTAWNVEFLHLADGFAIRATSFESRAGGQSLAGTSSVTHTLSLRRVFVFAIIGLLSGCAAMPRTTRGSACATGEGEPMAVYQLFFGRSEMGGGEVGHAAWNQFLIQVVTPNLPDGYTIFDAAGYWRSPTTGRQVRERTKVLLAAVADTAGNAAALNRIRTAYARRFHQESVGLTVARLCGAF